MTRTLLKFRDIADNCVTEDPDVLVGRMIGHLRRASGMTVRDLATSADLDDVHLASIEVGISAIDVQSAIAIARALDVSEADLRAAVQCIVRFVDR